ncbi:MAG: hypothetical protein Fur0036_09620 [Fimbriimonadaceae bacterium]
MPPDPARALRILRQVGVSAKDAVLATPQGVANETWLCGDWVLRISKDPEYLEDLHTESVAVPVAVGAGLPTPDLLHISLCPVGDTPPFSVYHRVHGQPLSGTGQLRNPAEFFRAYGAALRQMHSITEVADPQGYLDPPWELEIESLAAAAQPLGLREVVRALAERAGKAPRVFVHQDLHADNVLVDQAERPVFIDWGDAGLGDPAADFRYLAPCHLPWVREGYGEITPELEARIRLHVLDQYLYAQAHQRSYGPLADASEAEVVAFLRS